MKMTCSLEMSSVSIETDASYSHIMSNLMHWNGVGISIASKKEKTAKKKIET